MATYYCSPGGNDDTGDGSIGNPWATWEKLGNALGNPGDIGYVRGGTYTNTRLETYQCYWNGLPGTEANPIKIWAYPREVPIWDMSGMGSFYGSGKYQTFAIQMNQCDYVHVKGLIVKNFVQQNFAGTPKHFVIGLNLINSQHCTIENCTMDNIGGHGFSMTYEAYGAGEANVENSEYNIFLNCDAFSCKDPYSSGVYQDANGFNIIWNDTDPDDNNAWCPNTTFRGCRAAYCSDDGWDFYRFDCNPIYIENCWAYYNGYDTNLIAYPSGPQANGFKLGDTVLKTAGTNMGYVVNCIAAYNSGYGFTSNDDPGSIAVIWTWYNNFAYYNHGVGFILGYNNHAVHVMRNNCGWRNTNNQTGWEKQIPSGSAPYWDNSTYNAWNSTGNGWNALFTVSDADYTSLNISQLNNQRKSNGDLPDIDFGRLVSASDLIDKGVNVGYPYDGAAPDVGVYFGYEGSDDPACPMTTNPFIHSIHVN